VSGTDALRATRYLHSIHAAPDCERLRQLYCSAFGGIVFSENYYQPEDRDAALLYVADHMIEVMAPRHTDDQRFMFARYLAKMGPSYHSISFAVRDFPAALERCAETGLQLSTVGPGLLYLHPKSTGGIIMELTDHRMPNDPYDLPNWRGDWAQGRPNRPHAIGHVVCAPRDPPAAIAFLVEVLGGAAATPFTLEWPQRAVATPVQVADANLLILDPADRSGGPLAEFAAGPNAGLYALAWRVADAEAAVDWFGANGVRLERTAGEAPFTHHALVDGARHWFM
jgi:4-hydroxyphenylpyruvate dioxygenase-like putative hemolysin